MFKRKSTKEKILYIGIMAACFAAIIFVIINPEIVSAGTSDIFRPKMYATVWALVPPLIAISLALITKEVYSSLFIGIAAGALFYADFNPEKCVIQIFEGGFIEVLSDKYNVGILIFLVILGVMVALMNKAGGSAAFGQWASEHIKTRTGTQIVTILLGMTIFIDDYFNCLTVGSVMRPATDKQKISRAKLAYLIDATAAPICIIAPISSWAAAVSGFVEGEDGLVLFVKSIPYNYYALLTILMVFIITIVHIEFGPMAKHEENAANGDLFSSEDSKFHKVEDSISINDNGKVIDLLIPILSLVICCIIGMIYTGGFFDGENFITAFSQSDASVGLSVGSFFGLLVTVFLYVVRKVLSFHDCMDCLSEGFKAMVPAILILTFAWTLKGMTDSLGAKEFVQGWMQNSAAGFMNFLPAVVFIVGAFLAFATGTSWGTFGILIPIVVAVFSGTNHELMVISISACMAGAVCGDHCSPISDTTIMASAGAQCDHVNHVSTQLPYALVVALVSFVSYIFAGFVQNAVINIIIAVALLLGVLFIIKKIISHK